MYEARQNKEKVNRRIDSAGGGARQRVKTGNKRKDLIQNIKLADNNHVSQLMAWVITRELNLGMSQSSNSESSSSRAPQGNAPAGSSHGSLDSSGGAVSSGITLSPTILPIVGSDSLTNISSEHGSKYSISNQALRNEDQEILDAQHIIDQPITNNIDLQNRSSALGRILNLKFHHRHILFNRSYTLPVVGKSNNIGYGGVLYKESSLNGYVKNNNLSQDDIYITSNGVKTEDEILKEAISTHQNYGAYRLLTHNCQHWVNDVNQTFNNLKNSARKVSYDNEELSNDIESSRYLRSFFME